MQKYSKIETPIDFSVEKPVPNEKPVKNPKRFSGKKTVHTIIYLTLALTLLVLLITSLIVVISALEAQGCSVLETVVLYVVSVCIFESGLMALKKGLDR